MRALLSAIVLLTALLGQSGGAVHAQDERLGSSFLTPFPNDDIYQVLVVGDSFAEGLYGPLAETFAGDARVNMQRRMDWIGGVIRSDFVNRVTEIGLDVASESIDVAVVMVGEDDRGQLRLENGKRLQPFTPEWRQEYTRRIDLLAKTLRQRNVATYWVGLPVFGRYEANEFAQVANDIIRERAYLNGHKYIDAYAGFTDENGGYSQYGPDLTGKIRVLRASGGIYFTGAGNRKLAHFVEKELRRDLKQAKSERSVPLAGDEAEQARINPAKAASAAEPAQTSERSNLSGRASAPDQSGSNTAPVGAAGDVKNDTTRITLNITAPDGTTQAITTEVIRPAIPASVVAAMTRRENAQRPTQMGDVVVDQIGGGLTIMSSITPPLGAATRGRLSPTQAPSFRLLVKGEKLTPKPGRADDFTWPPPNPSKSGAAPAAATSPEG